MSNVIPVTEMPTVELFKGTGVQPWYLRLVSGNGEVLAVSEGYFSKWNAKRAARKNFARMRLRDTTKASGAIREDAEATEGTGSSS